MKDELSPFERKLREKQQAQEPATPILGFNPEDDAPELPVQLSEEDQQLDAAIAAINITDAYSRWCGKSKIHAHSNQKEGIKVSCPNPAHPDKNPSAWLNIDKNLYYCSGCAQGGDIWDIAAYHFGYPVPGYKDAELFRQLREKIALDLGFTYVKSGKQKYLVEPTVHTEPTAEVTEPTVNSVALLPSGAAHQASEEELQANFSGPEIDWQAIIPRDTFLHEWLASTTIDDCPNEYHFWTGLMAIGFAIGRRVTLNDTPPVVGNLYVCLVGPSGAGKSKAKRHLRDSVTKVLPHDEENPFSTGTKIIGAAGSGEYLVSCFSAPIEDPANPRKIIGYGPVCGYVFYEEFAALVATANRPGSTLKTQLMDVYDAQHQLAGGSITHGKRTAQDPFGQVIATTQNASLRNLITKNDDSSGFVNRWVYATGKLKPMRSWGGVSVDLTRPNEFLKAIYTWASSSRSLEMTQDALELWDDFFHGTLHPAKYMAELNGSAMLNRIDLLMKKLMLLLTANLKQTLVTKEVVEQVIALYPYLIASYGIANTEIKKTEEVENGNHVIEQIRRLTQANNRSPTGREIYNSVKRKFDSYKEFSRIIRDMVSSGLIAEEQFKPAVGRPSTRFVVND